MELVYVNPKLTENRRLAMEWFDELEPFIQTVFIQVFQLKEINHKTIINSFLLQ